ncbi:aspartyl protease family protein 1-like isoform X1 [Solanum pennellii]|uniref:Aspartyl protease family protein 1-like isoform X1 n=1 Tax=Solanum pennellii TaxID=28526 RepID=A0ABM1FZ39_SOLPN|nr:aspartyl protease family protein 1-like isoform X1 [Solanum pennellii]
MSSFVIFLLTLLSIFPFRQCHGRLFTFEMHHRFSETVKKWSLQKLAAPLQNWPVKGSLQYYTQLANHDRLLHGRRLFKFDGPLTFSDGNSTFRISSLGFLHYTTVTLGTPGLKFLVALDTGSDLFWVPCECGRCASTDDPTLYSSDIELSIYSLNGSSTSKKVTCSDSLCTDRNNCLSSNNHCPYSVSYVSSETSTSGILVDDILHLRTDDSEEKKFVQARVIFGCGQEQTGSFLDVAAPNGLFGLGLEKVSVPSILSQEGFMADSFSMCFGSDGAGRISFGDKGSFDQEETPFNINPLHPTYNISVDQIRVGTTVVDSGFTALFDTGTSFTYIADLSYTKLSESFHSQVRDKRRPPDPRIPFEYCYDMSPDENTSLIPSLSLTMSGGGQLAVNDPIIVISTQNQLMYCLAIVKSDALNIIGQNFMTGYRFVFDREKIILGWKKFDCYDIEKIDHFPSQPVNTTHVPPAFAVVPGNDNAERSHERTTTTRQSSFASSVYQTCYLNLINCFLASLILLLL